MRYAFVGRVFLFLKKNGARLLGEETQPKHVCGCLKRLDESFISLRFKFLLYILFFASSLSFWSIMYKEGSIIYTVM